MPARRYEFRVAGRLSQRVQGAFVDMTVADAPPETVISGEVLDDAHLHGVLAQIQNLGLHVVSVLQVPSAPEPVVRRTEPPSAPAGPAPSDDAR
jgi:hypothetical protein